MALNQGNEQRPEDARIAALYREAAGEMPPERLDRLIRDHARRPEQSLTPAKQRFQWSPWRLPFAAAAVAVISASLVVVMIEERGEPAALSPANPAPEARERSASRDEREPRLLSQAPTESEPVANRPEEPVPKAKQSAVPSLRSSAPKAPSEPKPIDAPHRPDAAPTDARVPSGQGSKARVAPDESQTSSVGGRDAAVAAAPPSAVPPATVSPPLTSAGPAQEPTTAAAKPVPPNNALASRRMEAARAAPKSSRPVAALIAELEGEPAARWIERIVTLRRDGRRQEADALLAEFKLRYPSEPLPAGLQRDDD